MEWFFPVAREFGVPLAVLAVVAVLLVSFAKWTGNQFLIPLRDRHFRFLDALEMTDESLEKTMTEIIHVQDRQTSILESHTIELKALRELLSHPREEVMRQIIRDEIEIHQRRCEHFQEMKGQESNG